MNMESRRHIVWISVLMCLSSFSQYSKGQDEPVLRPIEDTAKSCMSELSVQIECPDNHFAVLREMRFFKSAATGCNLDSSDPCELTPRETYELSSNTYYQCYGSPTCDVDIVREKEGCLEFNGDIFVTIDYRCEVFLQNPGFIDSISQDMCNMYDNWQGTLLHLYTPNYPGLTTERDCGCEITTRPGVEMRMTVTDFNSTDVNNEHCQSFNVQSGSESFSQCMETFMTLSDPLEINFATTSYFKFENTLRTQFTLSLRLQVHHDEIMTVLCNRNFRWPPPSVDINECLSAPCLNNGSCNDEVSHYSCICPIGYFGESCETSVCSHVECLNNGLCEANSDFANVTESDAFTCICQQGYTGRYCEENINDCFADVCIHGECQDDVEGFSCICDPGYKGGNCSENIDDCMNHTCVHGTCIDAVDSFVCSCDRGFTGSTCEEDIDDCVDIDCQNGGICVDTVNGFRCQCAPGYFGETCQEDMCARITCLHGGTCQRRDNEFGFRCRCQPGYSGIYCQEDVDDCVPCSEHGQCTDLVNDFLCLCDAGYTGRRCGVDIDECEGVTCQNGGTCQDGVNEFTCACAAGFSGALCEVNIDECESNPCGSNGDCMDLVDDISCNCHTGYTGDRCQENIDECHGNPCQNDAECVDVIASFICICESGYTGMRCEETIHHCTDVECQNGGSCVDDVIGFHCQCPPGYLGDLCQEDLCARVTCLHGGTCQRRDNERGYRCRCQPGYSGIYCQEDVDDCVGVACNDHGECRDLVDDFQCHCDAGYTGRRCAVNIDDCSGVTCQHGGACEDGVNHFTCVCEPGFRGQFCEENINECEWNPCGCHGDCTDLVNAFSCLCHAGYTGLLCQDNIDECSASPCANNGECVDLIGAARCICPPGTSGAFCQDSSNACTGVECQHGGSCVDEVNTFHCQCPPGYLGQLCQDDMCAHIECLNGGTCDHVHNDGLGYACRCPPEYTGTYCEARLQTCDGVACTGHGDCEELAGSAVCHCYPGYTGPRCGDNIDECSASPCANNGECVDLIGAARCICPPGTSGAFCQDSSNACTGVECQHGGSCVDEVNTFHCQCPPGYLGQLCQEDMCVRIECLNGGTCDHVHNDGLGYLCRCPPEYTGTYCEARLQTCDGVACTGRGDCEELAGSAVCHCYPGYTGPRCGVDMDECEGVVCEQGGSCEDGVNSFSCVCSPGYTGQLCQDEIDECASGPCGVGGECSDEFNAFSCTCHAGYTGHLCQVDIDECMEAACGNGYCDDLVAGFQCHCFTGFTGLNCQENIDDCAAVSCGNNGQCEDLIGGYHCQCQPGFTGLHCESDVNECDSVDCQNGGTCENNVDGFHCACACGYFGQFCEETLCERVECLNGGTCTEHNNNHGYKCYCRTGFTGTYCEENMDDCARIDCGHGHCEDLVADYRCICDDGFVGDFCEESALCDVANPILCDMAWQSDEIECERQGCCYIRASQQGGASQCIYPREHRCYALQCEHGARCAPRSSNGVTVYACHCQGNYYGERCQQECNEAEYHACENDLGACVPVDWLCDNAADCYDSSDENECSGSDSCGFYCEAFGEDQARCIDSSWRCDGEVNCAGQRDEINCQSDCESNGHFLCETFGMCVRHHMRCDGERNCPDGEDELDCGCQCVIASADGCLGFACNDGVCIAQAQRCDGAYDCGLGEDEVYCDQSQWCGHCEVDGRLQGCIPGQDAAKCICGLGSDPANNCAYSASPDQLIRVHSPFKTPYCSVSAESTRVGSVAECQARLLQGRGTVLALQPENSLCSVLDCVWDLHLQETDFSNIIYVLLPAGYHPCAEVDCGMGECVIMDLPYPSVPDFPALTYHTRCLCPDETGQTLAANCTDSDPCAAVTCQFGGTCHDDVTSNTYYCECSVDRFGQDCELTMDDLRYSFELTFILEEDFKSRNQFQQRIRDAMTALFEESVFEGLPLGQWPVIAQDIELSESNGNTAVSLTLSTYVALTTAYIQTRTVLAFDEPAVEYALASLTEVQVTVVGDETIFTCDFETVTEPNCEYEHLPSNFNWTRLDRDTPSAETGPYLAAVNAWFLYLEASSPRLTGDTAVLKTQTVTVYGQACLSFYLSMYGSEIGSLTIHQYTYNRHYRAFTKTVVYQEGGYTVRQIEDVSSFWSHRSIPVHLGDGAETSESYFELEGMVWTGSRGDIAIDYLTLKLDSQSCQEPCYEYDLGSETVSCCLAQLTENAPSRCSEQLFYQANCVEEGEGNPRNNQNTGEFFTAMTLYSTLEIMQSAYYDTLQGDTVATRNCYGAFDLSGAEPGIRLMTRGRDTTAQGKGRVELRMNGVYVTVCDDGFNVASARVVCAHLGLSRGEVRTDAFYGRGSSDIFFSSIVCPEMASKLYECTFTRDVAQVCTRAEAVGIICSIENIQDESVIGPVDANITDFVNSDDTEHSVFIPNVDDVIQRAGNVTQWNATFIDSVPDVYFQVWRPLRGADTFMLINQTHVTDIEQTVFPETGHFSVYSRDLTEEEQIPVRAGDVLGLYFPGRNPIPLQTNICYKSNEQLRYVYNPDFGSSGPTLGDTFFFTGAPLAWDPCRTYMLVCKIENEPLDSNGAVGTDGQLYPVNEPAGAVFFQSFEAEESEPGSRNDSWTRQSDSTPSLVTGPFASIRGAYYLYAEASGTQVGDQFVYETQNITLEGTLCVSFLYYMFGFDIGRLRVTMVDRTGAGLSPQVLLDVAGTQLDNWIWYNDKVSFKFHSGAMRFVATMRGGFRGDIAVDNILVIPGACPVESIEQRGGREEGEPRNVTYYDPVPDTRTCYIDSSANTNNADCTQRNPCRSANLAFEAHLASKTKILVFEDEKRVTYQLNLDNSPVQTQHIVLQTISESDRGRNRIQVDLLARNKCFRSVTIRDLKIGGDVSFSCGVSTSVTLENVWLQMNELFHVQSILTVDVTMEDTLVDNCLFECAATVGSNIRISGSTFEAPIPKVDALEGHIDRDKRATGLAIRYLGSGSTHVLRISDTRFEGLYQHVGREFPLGAISLMDTVDDSVIKITINSSQFYYNERALDLSISGDVDILIEETDFINNFADGSGGAVRMTATLESGLGSLSNIEKGRLVIRHCVFSHNTAHTSELYDPYDVYYQTRSPGNGGAIFVFVVVPSQLPKDGLVTIEHTQFHNNSASVQGGTIYINPEISVDILNSNFSNTLTDFRPKFGDILAASCNMTVRNTSFYAESTDGTTPVVSYQAADATNYRILLDNLYFECPVGFWIEELNTASFSRAGGLETFQLYCRGCDNDEYSLDISHATITGQDANINNSVTCLDCPYGAECEGGIRNTDGFWGTEKLIQGRVEMYQCPEEYCVQKSKVSVYYDACAEHRSGVLCGHCAEGYSESLFGTECIPNDDCGLQNWWMAVFLALYGIFYVFFFMFEGDWERFLSWVSKKVKSCFSTSKKKQDIPKTAENTSNTQTDIEDNEKIQNTEVSDSDSIKKKPISEDDDENEEVVDNSDVGKSGYFQVFMYFIQTASLLKVKIVVVEDEIYKEVHRPQDVLPGFLVDGFEKLFSFNINFLSGRTCLFKDLDVVSKTWMKLVFVSCLYGFVLFLYAVSCGCCACMPVNKRPRLGPLSNTVRILITILSLFLYTYQSVAEDAFLLLNCVTVDGDRVLFYDGSVSCLQEWQYAIVALVSIFIIPFFVILLFGPKLLEQKRIGIIFFFVSCLFPLFMALPISVMYFISIYKKNRSDGNAPNNDIISNQSDANNDANALIRHSQNSDVTDDEVNCCCGDVEEIREEIVDLLSGPYRTNIFRGVCYEGVLNFRRMIMVVLFTFITDVLLKQMALSMACFIILMIHIKAKPFRQVFSNYVESIALSLLLFISATNMVKAAFYHSQTVPRGTNYLLIVIFEWVEAACLGILPIAIICFLLIAMVANKGRNALANKNKANASANKPQHSQYCQRRQDQERAIIEDSPTHSLASGDSQNSAPNSFRNVRRYPSFRDTSADNSEGANASLSSQGSGSSHITHGSTINSKFLPNDGKYRLSFDI